MPEYDGSSINGDAGSTQAIDYDLYCPNVGNSTGDPNFWKSRCKKRLGDKTLRSCFLGCSEARKYPELKAHADKLGEKFGLTHEDTDRYHAKLKAQKVNAGRGGRPRGSGKLAVVPKEKRKEILKDMQEGIKLAITSERLELSFTALKTYRKLFREGIMDSEGSYIDA